MEPELGRRMSEVDALGSCAAGGDDLGEAPAMLRLERTNEGKHDLDSR